MTDGECELEKSWAVFHHDSDDVVRSYPLRCEQAGGSLNPMEEFGVSDALIIECYGNSLRRPRGVEANEARQIYHWLLPYIDSL